MQIDPKFLTPENYTNPRYIKITNDEIGTLYDQIVAHQNNVNPFLTRYEEIEAKKAELKKPYDDYCAEVKQELDDMMEKMQSEDQLAKKIKDKLVPMVEEEILPQLGELDEFVGLEKKDDGYYAKINDRIEEWIKAIREQVKK